jgi:anti-sigma regulatory factor (Ser/Thr protein kinase)
MLRRGKHAQLGRAGTGRRWRYRVSRTATAIGRFADALRSDLSLAGVIEPVILSLSVVLDELLANVVRHAPEARGPVHIRLQLRQGVLVVRLRHAADSFDPTEMPTPDPAQSLAEARCGGVGIALVRAMTDEFTHDYRRGENHIRIRMQMRQPREADTSPAS